MNTAVVVCKHIHLRLPSSRLHSLVLKDSGVSTRKTAWPERSPFLRLAKGQRQQCLRAVGRHHRYAFHLGQSLPHQRGQYLPNIGARAHKSSRAVWRQICEQRCLSMTSHASDSYWAYWAHSLVRSLTMQRAPHESENALKHSRKRLLF